MRRLLISLACAIFVLMLAVPVFAAGQLQFAVTPSVAQAAPGDQVVFEVSVKGDAYSSVGYIPTYDESVWELLGGECVTEESVLDEFSPVDGGVLALDTSAVRNGTVFRFTMKVRNNAPMGNTLLTGEVSARNDGGVMNTVLNETVIAIQTRNEPAQHETTSPTEQTQPVPPDNTVAATQATASSQAQTVATEETVEKVTVGESDTEKDSTLTIGQGTIPELSGDDCCVADDGDFDREATPAPKGNDTLLIWGVVAVVVAAGAAAAWFFLCKKKTE